MHTLTTWTCFFFGCFSFVMQQDEATTRITADLFICLACLGRMGRAGFGGGAWQALTAWPMDSEALMAMGRSSADGRPRSIV